MVNRNPIITCAVTGAGDTAGRHPDLPITPSEIATAALEAADAGAAIVHIHMRDPATGKGTRDVDLLARRVRVGLEDNLYLSRGVFASNADLVTRAREVVEAMGGRIQTPDQARETLSLA